MRIVGLSYRTTVVTFVWVYLWYYGSVTRQCIALPHTEPNLKAGEIRQISGRVHRVAAHDILPRCVDRSHHIRRQRA